MAKKPKPEEEFKPSNQALQPTSGASRLRGRTFLFEIVTGEVAELHRWAKAMNSNPPESFRELLVRYTAGERDFSGADLDHDPESDLSGAVLDGIDLSTSFVEACFRGASLRGAVFREANVKTCDFTDADLTDADFRGAGLCSARFNGAKLERARFEGAYIHSHVLSADERP